ncbi:ATP-binding protein [Methanolobus sp. ZRKC5]|uniref:ATP-binding protein n=1 Tax=unclassified Methanolobus TaxID=2629569 RepID=UPI00313C1935
MDKETASKKIKNRFARSNSSTSSNLILWKLLVPLVLAAIILIAAFSGIFWWQQNQKMDEHIQLTTIFVSEEYNHSLQEQSIILAEEMNWILENEKIETALEKRDVEQLMATSQNMYRRLSSVHNVTHIYFQGPDRVNLVRVHNPDKKGGFVDRFTIREAERTGDVVSGIELGSLGTFTLRVVKPIYINETLIGYFELGKEIEDILNSVAYKSDSEIAVFIYKDKLDCAKWENGMQMLGRDGNWSFYPTQALIYSTMALPEELDNIIKNEKLGHGQISPEAAPEFKSNGKTWHFALVPLMDASDDEVGYMIIMKDVTEDKKVFASNLKVIVIGSLVIFGILFIFYFIILDKTDKGILANKKELMDSEEKFRNIFEGAVEGINVSDVSTGKFRYVNPALCSMLGYTEEELMQQKTINIHPQNDLEQVLSELKVPETGEKTSLTNISCLRKDGTTIYVDISVFHAQVDGKTCTVGFYTDVTALKKIDDEMRAIKLAKLAAEESNRVKGEFLANMSHELRTPLNSIIGFSDMLRIKNFGSLNEKQSKFVGNISNSGKHLLELINDILDLSKVEAGKMELHCEEVDIFSIFKEVKDILDPMAAKKNITLEYTVNNQLSIIYADKIKLKQTLYNLVNNAIKFTDLQGNVSFSASTKHDMLHVEVVDTGIGISEDNLKKLFKPFTQLDSSTSKVYQGTGLGLSLVKKFVELHGGNVWVTSKPGEGSTFIFSIPLQREPKLTC